MARNYTDKIKNRREEMEILWLISTIIVLGLFFLAWRLYVNYIVDLLTLIVSNNKEEKDMIKERIGFNE